MKPARPPRRRIVEAAGEAAYVHADVSKESDAKAMVAFAVERFGALHVLYNNAGIMLGDDGSVDSTSEEASGTEPSRST